jgi:hypothetical protein
MWDEIHGGKASRARAHKMGSTIEDGLQDAEQEREELTQGLDVSGGLRIKQ